MNDITLGHGYGKSVTLIAVFRLGDYNKTKVAVDIAAAKILSREIQLTLSFKIRLEK